MKSSRISKKAVRTIIALVAALLLCAAIVIALVLPFSLNTLLFRFGPTPDIMSISVSVIKKGHLSSYFQTDNDEEIRECLDLISDFNISFVRFSSRMSFQEYCYDIKIFVEDEYPISFSLADTGNIGCGRSVLKISDKQSIDPFVSMVSTWTEQQIE